MADSDIVVSGLATAAGISYNALTYATDDPHEGGLLNQSLDVVEVWASQTNNRTSATKVAEGNKTNALHVALGNGETWYYWIKARNKQGYYGEWYPLSPTAGIEGTTAQITAAQSGISTEWTSYVPEVTAGSGSLTTVSDRRGSYFTVGKLCVVNVEFDIDNNGTGANYLLVELPLPAKQPLPPPGVGSGFRADTSEQLRVRLSSEGLLAQIFKYDGSYPGATGAYIAFSLAYELEDIVP